MITNAQCWAQTVGSAGDVTTAIIPMRHKMLWNMPRGELHKHRASPESESDS